MPAEYPPGIVISYPYLWRREADKGETEGRKSRPVCLAISVEMRGKTFLYLLPITSKSPQSGQAALEIPSTELLRIGLNAAKPAWLVISEYNRDSVGESFYLNPRDEPLGRFSGRFMLMIQKSFVAELRAPSTLVDRSL